MLESLVARTGLARSSTRLALSMTAAMLVGLCGSIARADDFTNKANKPYTEVPKAQRSDLVLIPVLMKLDAPTKEVSTLESAMLMPSTSAGAKAASAWASAKPQQDALKVLADITKEKDWKKAYAFALPYGIDDVPLEFIQAGMFIDLGDPPTLAGAKIQYLPALDHLAILCHVEATRLASEGKINDAIDVLTNLLFFSRQMADRQFNAEVSWGLSQMRHACERIRDVVYVDSREGGKIDGAKLKDQIKRFDDKSNAYLDLGRVRFPEGDRAAAEQLTSRVYTASGTVDQQVFASTMSRLTSTTHPLRLFSESGKWRSIGASQAPRDEAVRQVDGLFSDWAARWTTPWFDKRMSNVVQFNRFDKSRFAALGAVVPDMTGLQYQRHLVRVELVGTRTALAVAGYARTIGKIPPQLTAVRPAWLPGIDPDPYNPNTANDAKPPLAFFVPIRDTAAINGAGNPHEMEIIAGGVPFQVKLQDDVFVLYSVGSDNAKVNAKRVQNTSDVVQGADYLIWPPVVSLLRQNLLDRGELK
ncbi:MAG: hypothetical protein NTV94_06220 [Planctomycetota bacterium]|nr:hypothetical protein [Planctomycetota bacterium]